MKGLKHKDPRPYEYLYWRQLVDHLNGDTEKLFNDDLVYPRQLELHFPHDRSAPCNLSCPHCAGRYYSDEMDKYEYNAFCILEQLKGKIPYIIMGGSFTEPFGNMWLFPCTEVIKKYGSYFGFHTNGCKLKTLEENSKLLTELNYISTDRTDYVSIAIDAGISWDWAKTKGTKEYQQFQNIVEATKMMIDIRDKNGGNGHAVRWCYLISPHSGNEENFMSIIALAKRIGVDSLRFSIPFAPYNQDFGKVKQYRDNVEQANDDKYYQLLKPYLSKSQNERPYIFYNEPWFTDISRFNFDKCFYFAYQITMGADGYYYKCSTVSNSEAAHLRLGKVTDKIEDFENALKLNKDLSFSCKEQCFSKGLRCNRMGIEISDAANDLFNERINNGV